MNRKNNNSPSEKELSEQVQFKKKLELRRRKQKHNKKQEEKRTKKNNKSLILPCHVKNPKHHWFCEQETKHHFRCVLFRSHNAEKNVEQETNC